MASRIRSNTKEIYDEPIESVLQTKLQNKNDINVANKIEDYYDESLPKNEYKFMAPVRRWEKRMGFETAIRWSSLIIIALYHIGVFLYILYLTVYCEDRVQWKTVIVSIFCGLASGFGVTGGTHRYWSHRSFKAKNPLQWILLICYSIAGQNSIPNWVRDHRIHHKMLDTSGDPHNAKRGFFFTHVGWLMMRKHPHVIREGKKIDMSDILNDPLIQFHTKYFNHFKLLFNFIIPIIVPMFFWGETFQLSLASTLVRYTYSLHCTWSVNSFAHMWGNKPYDVKMTPAENWKVSILAMGEGWHNYHHTFPWDYKASELGYFINVTTIYIDFFKLIGWAYDMKTASSSIVKAVKSRRGHRDNTNCL